MTPMMFRSLPLAVPCLAAAALTVAAGHATVLFDVPGHAAMKGASVVAEGGEPDAPWTLLDWRGRTTGVSGVFDGNGKATLPPLATGYYRMMDGFGSEGGPITSHAILATLAVLSPPRSSDGSRPLASGETLRESFYGVDCAFDEQARKFDCPWNGGDAVLTLADLARLAGFSHVRGRHHWARMQPSPDPPDCAALATSASLFRDRGIGVSGLFYGTPAWTGPNKLLTGNLAAVYLSCRDISAAFADTIEDWEFLNEPDIGVAPPVWDYAAAFKAASLGFKASDPRRPVLCAGLCQDPRGPYLGAFLENDAASFFDVFNYHTYAAPSQYHTQVAAMREVLGRVGAEGRPIWITESGTNVEGLSDRVSVHKGFKAHSPEQELVVAEFFPKSQIALQMEGVARNYAFILAAYGERSGAKDWGLMRRDGTVKPAYAALATMARELGDATLVGPLAVGDGGRAYLFDHPDGSQTVAFWSESPIDTATDGATPVTSEPDFAREVRLNVPDFASGGAKTHGADAVFCRLVDMCGAVSEVALEADGALVLPATRFPAYVTGLRGLRGVASPVRGAPAARPRDGARTAGTSPTGGDLPVVLRVDLNPDDFEISNNKTLAVAKGDAPRLRVQAWNLSETAMTGRVEVSGAILDGLPEALFGIGPFDCAEFDCALRPTPESAPSTTLTLRFTCGERRSTRLAMPVFFEALFLASCEVVSLDWMDPAKWIRNDSANASTVVWDDEEQALRFDLAWSDPQVGRWFYPALQLPPDGPDFSGVVRVAFEVKSVQDKVENDFDDSRLMLVRGGKGGSSGDSLRYLPPTGAWERRQVDLPIASDLQNVDAIRLGANPRGMRLTFWIRNVVALRKRGDASR